MIADVRKYGRCELWPLGKHFCYWLSENYTHTNTHTHTHTHTHTQNGEVGLEKCYPKNTVVVVSVSQYDAFILSFLN